MMLFPPTVLRVRYIYFSSQAMPLSNRIFAATRYEAVKLHRTWNQTDGDEKRNYKCVIHAQVG